MDQDKRAFSRSVAIALTALNCPLTGKSECPGIMISPLMFYEQRKATQGCRRKVHTCGIKKAIWQTGPLGLPSFSSMLQSSVLRWRNWCDSVLSPISSQIFTVKFSWSPSYSVCVEICLAWTVLAYSGSSKVKAGLHPSYKIGCDAWFSSSAKCPFA